jgi:hypothetical protein
MATVPPTVPVYRDDYPTSDGKPMAETDRHRDLMQDLIQTLQEFFASSPRVYVSGNLLLFYERGNRRRYVSPDVLAQRDRAIAPPASRRALTAGRWLLFRERS